MPESAVNNERRQHQRLPVSAGIIAVLITSTPEIIGSVSDISLGGAKITYHNPTNREIDYTKLKVDLISDDRFVEAIPCSNAWDRPLENNSFLAAGELRQCGIKFSNLNPNQAYLLRSFINRCAAPGVLASSQAQRPAASSH
jgi:c-di-GMP-binding flagellar brake protein YcgR